MKPLLLLLLCLPALGAAPVLPATVPRTNLALRLEWVAPANTNGVTGYVIRHGLAPGAWVDMLAVDGAGTTSATWSNALAGATHYFAAYTVNTLGLESDPSNVVQSVLEPRPVPPTLRQVVPLVVVIQSRPTDNAPWVERLRLGPFNALAAMPTEQFRVALEANPPSPILPDAP